MTLTTHRSLWKTLSIVSSLVSSSVTPPNIIPILFADHSAIVQPDRIEGAKAVEGLLRFSHLIVRGSAGAFPSVGIFKVRLRGLVSTAQRRHAMRYLTEETKYLPTLLLLGGYP